MPFAFPAFLAAFAKSFAVKWEKGSLTKSLVEDTASITLKFKNNTLCIIDTSRRSNKYDQRMEVFCSDGTTDIVGYDPTNKSDYYEGLFNSFEERYEKAYKLELDHFADVLQYNTKQEVTENDCIQNTLIADKCCMSAIEKRVIYNKNWNIN